MRAATAWATLSIFYTLFLLILVFTAIPIAQGLSALNFFQPFLTLTYLTASTVAAGYALIHHKKFSWFQWVNILLILSAYIYLFKTAEVEIERAHLVTYAFLAFLYRQTFRHLKFSQEKILGFAAGLALSVNLLDECLQFFAPNRFPQVIDIGYNALASLLALAFLNLRDD